MAFCKFTENNVVIENMAKNITVQIGDDLAVKMEKLRDVNWSEVVRDCVDKYCNLRLGADIEALAQKMKLQKEESYSDGYKAALAWFKREYVGYAQVNEFFLAGEQFDKKYDDEIKERYGCWEHANDDNPGINEQYMREQRQMWREKITEILRELEGSFEVTDAFIDGFKQALHKLSNAS